MKISPGFEKNRPSLLTAIFVLVWLSMQVIFYLQKGIVTNLEATKYLHEATLLLQTGKYSSNNFLFYSVQILLIAFCIKFNISFSFIVILQILVNGISIICFFRLIKNLTGRKTLAYTITFYFLIFYYYHEFNTYLFTESLFFSFSVIYTCFLFSVRKISWRNGIAIFLFIGLLYLTRPTGIFFLPATYLFLVIRFFQKRALKIIGLSCVFALPALYILINYSLGSGGEFDFLLPLNQEMIICGLPTVSTPHQISLPVDRNSIEGLLFIVAQYPGLFISLAVKRLGTFFGVSRDFYSTFHNIVLSVYFYTIYLVILSGLRSLFSKHKAEFCFLITNISLMTLTVMLSCDEWSNRFIFSQLPFFLLLATISIVNKKQLS